VSDPDRGAGEESKGSSGRSGNAVPEERVTTMFDSIAPVYDRMNTLMTAGMDGRWRRAAVHETGLRPGGSVLDVACGTGKMTGALAGVAGPQGRVVGVDLSQGMLDEAGKALSGLSNVELRLGNALALPVESAIFDAATIAFGLRNLSDFEAGFREMARAVRPGGRVVCLELSQPRPRILGSLYRATFRVSAPVMGTLFRRRSAYAYLPNSLRGFPEAESLAETMRRAGLAEVRFRCLSFGAVAVHVGVVAGGS
jgi:demethylmenaquinone methyltransferase / 2-methoxy-6-polyprenyl-1,4-benzoquinol methylase